MNKKQEEALVKKLRKIYKLPGFSGLGALSFKAKLSIDKNIKAPLPIIIKSLNGIPDYVSLLKNKRVHEFRHYNIPNRRVLGELDICLLKPVNGYKGLLLLIDCFTRYLWYEPLKTKTKVEVTAALKKILEKSGKFDTLSSDPELRFLDHWLNSKGIFYHKVEKTKHPSFIESAQRSIKVRIYANLRLNHSNDWTKIVKQVIESINESSHKGIFGLTPAVADRGLEGVLAVQLAREKYGPKYEIFSKKQQEEKRQNFISKKANALYLPGRYCMADISFSRKILKGHNPKRAAICKISDIDFSAEPPLFSLKSAYDNTDLPIKYYQSQLKPLLADPKKVDKKFQEIIKQRESPNALLEVLIKLPNNTKKWVKVDDYLMQK